VIVLDSLPPSHTVAIDDSRRSVPAHSYTEITRRGCVAFLTLVSLCLCRMGIYLHPHP
jgi:hypothetical protein